MAKWSEVLGDDMMHLHHYCQGLVHLARGERNYKDRRAGWARNALDSFNYVLKAAKPNSFLLPDIYINKGKAYLLSKKDSLAEAEFSKAIELKPDYVPAYAALADYYVNARQRDKAFQVVEAGLKQSPDSRALRRRYQELGGNPAAIVPAVPKQPLAGEEKTPASMSEGKTEPSTPTVSAPSEKVQQPTEPDKPAQPPKIGSPTNPWCRFCPD